MSAVPLPPFDDQEHRRLARLRMLRLLDTRPEPVFDALVRVAAVVCGKPIALISLLDEDRQWFKANTGLEGVEETPRSLAFCDHAIRSDAVMEVHDATRDARFEANPLVTGEPYVRYYAGAPITMPAGERIGTLCVIDHQPGALAPEQLDALRDLAAIARWTMLQRERLGAQETRELREAHGMLTDVLQALPCGLAVYGPDGRLSSHNHLFQRLLELPQGLLDTQPQFEDIVRYQAQRGEYGPGEVEDHVARVTGYAHDGRHMQRVRPDGTALDIRSAPLPDGGFVTTYLDVSSVKSAERALRESEERQKRALDASRLALWELDIDSGWMYLSENWSQLLGGPATPTITTPQALEELVPAEEQASLRGAMRALLKGEADSYAVEHRVTRKDGSHAWIHSEGRVTLRGADGRALYATGTNQDVTARKLAELEHERSATLTRATIEAAAEGIAVVDADRKMILHNTRLLEMWGFPPHVEGADALALGRMVRSQLRDPAAFLQRSEELHASDVAESLDILEFRDGRIYERSSRRIELGGRSGRVWTFRDITAQRAAEREVNAAKEAAEAANRAKSDFLDNVSHEIRTPLNGVLGLTRLLLAENLTPQQRQYVQLADASAGSLLELINDLLDLGKIEAGRMELEDAPFRLDELLGQLDELYQLRAREKGLRFELEIAPDVPSSVSGDAGRLRQVLNNLLSNALKFTERGEFGLLVRRTDASRGSNLLRFTVYDTGIGIPYDKQQRLFTRFTQAERSTSRQYGGTGLGLAIVKQLCDQMGGGVLLQSEPGRGASFRVELPLRPARAPAAAGAAAPPRQPAANRGARILVAEDNPTNQVVVRGLLAQAGYRDVTIVDDGQQAVDAALLEEYDLVLMDCRMPVLDGYAASMRLRAQGFTSPIVALTANAAAGERERCLAHGMNDYLAKPVDATRLAQVLGEWTLPGDAAAPARDKPAAMPAGTGFQRTTALDRLGGDEELLAVALASFREHAPKVLQAARDAFAGRQGEDLHRHLHSFAGSAGMVGADPLRERAKALELEAQSGRLDEAGAGLDGLAALLDEFLAASASW